MKAYNLIALCVIMTLATGQRLAGQGVDSIDFFGKIKEFDLTNVIRPDSIEGDNDEKFKYPEPLGFIGPNYQRFQIHITSITKTKNNPYTYNISGKTKVKNNICSFTGTITVIESKLIKSEMLIDIGISGFKQGYLNCNVLIYESKSEPGSGFIQGKLTTAFFIDNYGKIKYDALMLVADGYSNNQFEGTWTSYKTGKTKKCNWGDFRIPDSGDLDGGAGEFYPSEKYLENGWRTYYNSITGTNDDAKVIEAIRIENLRWWE